MLWGHSTHLNQLKTESVTRAYKTLVNDLDYEGIEFPVSRKDYSKIEHKKVFINMFLYENDLVYSVYASNKKFKDCMDLLLINISYFVSISKILTDLCPIKQKIRIENTFSSSVYNVLVVKKEYEEKNINKLVSK